MLCGVDREDCSPFSACALSSTAPFSSSQTSSDPLSLQNLWSDLCGLLLMLPQLFPLKCAYFRGKEQIPPSQESRQFRPPNPVNPIYLGCHLSMLILVSVSSGAVRLPQEMDKKDLMIPFFPQAFKRHRLSLINFSRGNPYCFVL